MSIIDIVGYQRDPVSLLFDAGAARLLARAYARPGRWAGTRIALPRARHLGWAAAQGIYLYAPDPVTRTRWMRGFARAVYHANAWHVRDGKITAQRRMTRNPQGIRLEVGPWSAAGWPVRIKVVTGSLALVPAAESYVRHPGLRSDPGTRDWQASA